MRMIDWSRSYARNIGGSGGPFTQDGVDFNHDGTEFVWPVEPEPDTAAEDALEAAAEEEPGAAEEKPGAAAEEEPDRRRPVSPPPLAAKRWQEIKRLYQFHGFQDWSSLPPGERRKTAIARIRAKLAT